MKARTVMIRLTEKELWELINNFGQSYQSGLPENSLADRVMDKLNTAHEQFKKE